MLTTKNINSAQITFPQTQIAIDLFKSILPKTLFDNIKIVEVDNLLNNLTGPKPDSTFSKLFNCAADVLLITIDDYTTVLTITKSEAPLYWYSFLNTSDVDPNKISVQYETGLDSFKFDDGYLNWG